MQLDRRFIRLPLQFDAARLAEEIAAVEESQWRPHPQGFPGNSALPLVARDGDPTDDRTRGVMAATPVLRRLPYLRQVMARFDSCIGRSRLMRIDGNAEATSHVDVDYYWLEHLRVHVPVVTDPAVLFHCGKESLHMRAGECWVFDTFSLHNVVNPQPSRRIHLVVDLVGSAAFWALLERARADPLAEIVPYLPGVDAWPVCERHNVAAVLHPHELRHWADFLLKAARADVPAAAATLADLSGELTRLAQDWRDGFARYGDGAAGHAHFRQLARVYAPRVRALVGNLRLANSMALGEILDHAIFRVAVDDDPAAAPAPVSSRAKSVAPSVGANHSPAIGPPANSRPRFDRPVFIVCPPRSGSSLLFETLAASPDLYSVGGESHQIIENLHGLHPAANGWQSNRLLAGQASAVTVSELSHGWFNQLRDRDGQAVPLDARGLRLLEKTPKNALRLPFLAAAYPDAQFIVLYREPREAISSMLDAWRSGRFVTYPNLPGWSGPPWSLLLVPGWREWQGRELAEVAARQWAVTVQTLLDDLADIAPARVALARYDALLADPREEIDRLCGFLGVRFDRGIGSRLPSARHTLTAPEPGKWRKNAEALERVLPIVADIAARWQTYADVQRRNLPVAAGRVAAAIGDAAATPVSPAPGSDTYAGQASPAASTLAIPAAAGHAFASSHSGGFLDALRAAGAALAISTYQSGRVILLRATGDGLNTHFRAFPSPMGMAFTGEHLALATTRQVWHYRNQPEAAVRGEGERAADACYVPRASHYTGDIRIHEIGFAGGELWLVNTRFSCLCTLSPESSFVPRWQPSFISALEPSDRCHLNGLCIVDGRLRFVSALGRSDVAAGWREHKAAGGLIIDIKSGEFVAEGLSMPHSPRWHAGRLWVLESGKGTLATIDLGSGRATLVCELPGFARGLAFAGNYAFIGLSQVREGLFGGLPLTERLVERVCGVWVVDIERGSIVGFLRFDGQVQEIFDLQFTAGHQFPELLEPEDERLANVFEIRPVPRRGGGPVGAKLLGAQAMGTHG